MGLPALEGIPQRNHYCVRFPLSVRKRILNRYELGGALGQGGMGVVYRGMDTQTNQPVAIKVLKPEMVVGDPEAVERFAREAEALRALDHPNIVKVLATAKEDEERYLVMEFNQGGSLRDVLDRDGRLSIARTLEIALDLADALTRAHRLGIIHRDLKPSNVLLAEDGASRLSDFGLARMGVSNLTQVGIMLGTPAYLSPEVCQGAAVDARADIWAFGVMLFEMLTGQLPFEGENLPAVLMAIMTQPVPDLETLRPDAPIPLLDLVYRMLEKDREARVPSVRLVGAELEAIMQGRDISHFTLHTSVVMPRFGTPTPHHTGVTPHNLPAQTNPFVGREAELVDLTRLITDPDTRLVTILSPGGMGKTRLALEVAEAQLPEFGQGVYFVPLAPLSSAENIIPAIAEAVGFQFYGGQDPKGQLLGHLRGKQMMLVMDNFEHVLESAGLVSEVLRAAPKIKVLATSREKLNLQEETRFHIEGMDFPEAVALASTNSPEEALAYGAVKLFVQGARRARPDFDLEAKDLDYVARICQLVEGMPLGILLASAWVEMFSPREIEDEIHQCLDFLEIEMRDLPERHHSIRAVFDSSWNKLEGAAREVFMKLSVFRGGFTRQAAQAVVDVNLRNLISLVNKSLLRRDPSSGRYEIHELLRQYAGEQLEAAGMVEAARADHCAYYTKFMGQHLAEIRGPRQVETLNKIEADLENVRAAWHWAVKQKDYVAIDRASESLYVFFEWLNRYSEGEEIFQEAREGLAPQPGEEPHPSWGRVLLPWYDLRLEGRGRLERTDIIKAQAESSLAAARKLGDQKGIAHALVLLGAVAKDLTLAIEYYRQGLDHYHEVGDSFWVMIRIGLCCRKVGQIEEAIKSFQQSLDRGRELDDKVKMAWSLTNIGETVIIESDHVDERLILDVENRWREAHRLFGQIRSPVGIAWTCADLCLIALLRGDYEEVEALAEEALAVELELTYAYYGKREALGMLSYLAIVEGDFAKGKQLIMDWMATEPSMRKALKSTAVYCRPATMIIVVPAMAFILAHEGEKERAVELLAMAYHHPASPTALLEGWPFLARLRSELKDALSPEVYNAAWGRGKALDFDTTLTVLTEQFQDG